MWGLHFHEGISPRSNHEQIAILLIQGATNFAVTVSQNFVEPFRINQYAGADGGNVGVFKGRFHVFTSVNIAYGNER